jgi:hypothetical protein
MGVPPPSSDAALNTQIVRSLARRCGMSLRDVDRALWVAANDPELAG